VDASTLAGDDGGERHNAIMLRRAFLVVTISAVCVGLLASAVAVQASARTISVRDEGQLHYRTDNATTIVDEGPVHGTIPGQARVYFVYNGSPNVSAHFTIRTSSGWLSGWARCRLHNPSSRVPSFRGALHITGGGGRYAAAHGSGELFGLFYRRGYGLVVQAIGTLRY
jgi:hypothetical protein